LRFLAFFTHLQLSQLRLTELSFLQTHRNPRFPSICNKISISTDCKEGYKLKTSFPLSFYDGSVLEVWETSAYVAHYANIQNFYEGEKQKENAAVICMKFFLFFHLTR